MNTKLPDITQQPINHIDGTPDKGYVLRILKSYRMNCDCRWVSSKPNEIIDFMNTCQDERAKLLDEAIGILDKCLD